MSFQEKSTWAVLVAMILVYGRYFAIVGSELESVPVTDIDYQGAMLFTVVVLVVMLIVAHILIAVASRGDDSSDERDRVIDRFGESVGGSVLGTGALATLALAMLEIEHFWIANAILLSLVLSEIVSSIIKIVLYRRGTVSW